MLNRPQLIIIITTHYYKDVIDDTFPERKVDYAYPSTQQTWTDYKINHNEFLLEGITGEHFSREATASK